MKSSEDLRTTAAPVFVDDTGRRRVLTRRAGRVLVIGFATYLGLMVVGFARGPRVGSIHLPTFGLPSLGLMVPPAPAVAGEQTDRSGPEAEAEEAAATGRAPGDPPEPADSADAPGGRQPAPGGPGSGGDGVSSASGGPSLPGLRSTPPGPATTTTSATTTTTARPSGSGPKASTTTTSTTTTSTTTSTATPGSEPGRGSGQGSGQGAGPVAAKGPDGSGAPGQQRKTTTTTSGLT